MTTQISTTNIQPAALAFIQGPVVSSIQITNSSYTVLDDTAVDTAGGYIRINGVNFVAGMNVVIGSVTATSVSVVSSTVLNVQVPAQSAGTYIVYVIAPDGGVSIVVNGLTYSGIPSWVTGSTLTSGQVNAPISIQLSATGATSYALAAGSSLPAGLTLSSGGLLSGTVSGITVETLYNFTVNAIDNELQDSPRAFSITITASDQYFDYITTLLSANTPTSTFVTDASTNSFAVTVNGDTRPSNFGPYTPGYYSGYFDGTGDYLSIADNVNLEFGSSTITVECWFYMTGSTGYLLDKNNSGTGAAPGFSLYVSTTQIIWYYDAENNGYVISPISTTITQNAWHHIALVRSVSGSTTNSVFLDGVRVGTSSTSNAFPDNSQPFRIGATFLSGSPYSPFTGYISNVRLVKGTAVYDPAQTTITVPTIPLTAVENTQLLTCQSNRFIDNSTNNFTITRNGDTLISGFDPFVPSGSFAGRGSGFFDGTGDFLSAPDNEAFNLTGDFTIECWLYPTSHPTAVYLIGQTSSTDYAPVLLFLSSGRPGIAVSSNGSTWTINGNVSTALTLNTWSHVAAVRSGNKWSIYVNGVENVIAASTAVTPYNSTDPLGIGGEAAGTLNYPYVGYMTDVRIVKGTAVYTTNFTPPTAPLTAIANTSLLTLQNNQPNNNSMFLDSSTSNFNITRNGNTTQGSFSPYGGGWSNYFDGTGDYLTVPYSQSMVQWWDTDYTIEMWVYNAVNAASPTNSLPLQVAYGLPTANDTYWAFGTNAAGNLYWYYWNGSSITNAVSTSTVSLNTWTHVAMVHTNSTGTIRGYINGVEAFSVAKSGTPQGPSGSTVNIGATQNRGYTGYISNLRIVRGTRVYTSAFTPPTAPLTPIANTSLLTCADNRFIDDSVNNFAITRNGDTSVQRFNPFNPVTTTPTSYSGYFDGNGDYLSIASNAALSWGTGDYTVEAWVYLTSAQSRIMVVSGVGNFAFFTNSSANIIVGRVGTDELTSTGTVTLNQWVHIAATRSSNTTRIFINGTLSSTPTSITTNYGQNLTYIGSDATIMTTGYISNFRAIKGTALYTSNFTPSTTPLTAVANTSLLTLQSPTFIDNSTNNFTITNNGDTAPRQFNPFGWTTTTGSNATYTPALYGGSAYFDGNGDSLTLAGGPVFTLGSPPNDFTIECWVYLTTTPGNYAAFMTTWTDAATFYTNRWFLGIASSKITWYSSAGNIAIQDSVNVPLNQWIHVAAVRNGSTTTLYKNGVALGTQTTEQAYTTNGGLTMGYAGTNSNYITGYISDARIFRGTALYKSNFQPPIAPLTALQNTVLLNNMTGAGIYDSSMMANYETLGNASINTSIKKYGTTSMYFDGSGDYVFAPSSATTRLAGDFTIELWAYRAASGNYRAFTIGDTVGTSGIEIYVSGTPTGNWVVYSNSATRITGASATRETWTHLALVRSGSTVTLYVNGTASGSAWSSSATFSGAVYVGAELFNSGVTSDTNGYIDDFRITNGIARYTSNFTPPSTPFINF